MSSSLLSWSGSIPLSLSREILLQYSRMICLLSSGNREAIRLWLSLSS